VKKARRSTSILLALLVAAGSILVASPAYAGNPVKWNNPASGWCMSPAGGSNKDNAAIVMYYCTQDKLSVRYWQNDTTSNTYIKNYGTGKCLTPAGGRADSGAPIVQFGCDNDASRKWNFYESPFSPGLYTIRPRRDFNLCLTAFFPQLNAQLYQITCNPNNEQQQWRFFQDR
jgi:hypothetical protein